MSTGLGSDGGGGGETQIFSFLAKRSLTHVPTLTTSFPHLLRGTP